MKRYLLVIGFLILFSSLALAATCNNPDRSISASVDRTHEDNRIRATIVTNVGGPFTICTCPIGNDCSWFWQYRKITNSPSWETIPNSGTVADWNCTGVSCRNQNPLYTNGGSVAKDITCVNQGEYEIQGYNQFLDLNTAPVRLQCYPYGNAGDPDGCTPPASGNFNQNQFCHFIDVDLWLARNYNIIIPLGHSIHDGSDINFSETGHFLQIWDGAKLDLNDSDFFVGGLTFSNDWTLPPLFYFLLLLLGLLSIPIYYFSSRENNTPVSS